jgi:hypothetical protein
MQHGNWNYTLLYVFSEYVKNNCQKYLVILLYYIPLIIDICLKMLSFVKLSYNYILTNLNINEKEDYSKWAVFISYYVIMD